MGKVGEVVQHGNDVQRRDMFQTGIVWGEVVQLKIKTTVYISCVRVSTIKLNHLVRSHKGM